MSPAKNYNFWWVPKLKMKDVLRTSCSNIQQAKGCWQTHLKTEFCPHHQAFSWLAPSMCVPNVEAWGPNLGIEDAFANLMEVCEFEPHQNNIFLGFWWGPNLKIKDVICTSCRSIQEAKKGWTWQTHFLFQKTVSRKGFGVPIIFETSIQRNNLICWS